jgi:predicted nucleic acid-binding protein
MSLSSLTDPNALLIADASTVINVNASGCAKILLESIPARVVVVGAVLGELEEGRERQHQDAIELQKLVASRHIEIVTLDEVAEQYFEQLVVGPAEMTLDDGEAATIAYAVRQEGIAIIDERKASRICSQLFPELGVGCTVNIFKHPNIEKAIGRTALSDAVFNALFHGRMRVFHHDIEWVVSLIGTERAALCASLPSSVRNHQSMVARALRQVK